MKLCTIKSLKVTFLLVFYLSSASCKKTDFPKDFIFSTATSAYQIEGGWNADGKGVSIWDLITYKEPGLIKDNSTGDIACDSYHKYPEDVEMLNYIGVNAYRFSIAWSRIFPNSAKKVNQAGVDYYKNLTELLLANNITPMASIYHWDMPVWLAAEGGFQSEKFPEYYEKYCNVLFKHLGHLIKYWFTFNEPNNGCMIDASFAFPNHSKPFGMVYNCYRNTILAHARAYHLYEKNYKPKQNGSMSIVIDSFWYEPATNSTEDIEARDRYYQFMTDKWWHPIYKGDYPPEMVKYIEAASEREGLNSSKLRKLKQREIESIKGTSDFLCLNYYSSRIVANNDSVPDGDTYEADAKVTVSVDPKWKQAEASTWLYETPWNLRPFLKSIKCNYNNPEIMITENGIGDHGGPNDTGRMDYMKDHLVQCALSINKDHVKLIGYTAWSLMDNFEWVSGYTSKFGIYSVDFDDPDRPRTPKQSAEMYKQICETRSIPK